MPSEEMEGASPPWGSHPHGAKGTLGTWRAHGQHGGRAQNRPLAVPRGGSRLWSNQEKMGRMCHQHLNFISTGKVHGREAKASNRTGEIPPSGIIGEPTTLCTPSLHH